MFYTWINETPVGRLLLAGDDTGLKHVAFECVHFSSSKITPGPHWEPEERRLKEARRQLDLYFRGKLRKFELPTAADGTDFQKRVWGALQTVSYGETATYGEIAGQLGQSGAARAVGLANGQNPLAIIIPCHRIVGTGGKLTGYGGGIDRKQLLLRLESGKDNPVATARCTNGLSAHRTR